MLFVPYFINSWHFINTLCVNKKKLNDGKVLYQSRKQRHTFIYSEPVRILNEVAKLEYVHYTGLKLPTVQF